MIKRVDGINFFSGNAKNLADFYSKKVGMKITMEGEMGENDEKFFGIEFGKNAAFFIMDHSEVKGKNSDPKRIIVNFEVDDIDSEVANLKKNGVKVVQEKYHVESYGYIATFEDVDGNYFQLVQVKAN